MVSTNSLSYRKDCDLFLIQHLKNTFHSTIVKPYTHLFVDGRDMLFVLYYEFGYIYSGRSECDIPNLVTYNKYPDALCFLLQMIRA